MFTMTKMCTLGHSKRVYKHLLYYLKCSSCNSAYIGKTNRHYLVIVFEHLGISFRTGNKFTFNAKNINNTAVLMDLNFTLCSSSLDDFSIIDNGKNNQLLHIKESQKLMLKLKITVQSMPLECLLNAMNMLIYFRIILR